MSALEDLKKARLEKIKLLEERKINPYPEKGSFALSEIAAIKQEFKKYARQKKSIGIGGRILGKREHGGSIFVDLFDGTERLQAFIGRDKIGSEKFSLFSDAVDMGDFIAVQGKAFYTKKKEPTIEAVKWEMLSKSILPLPEKWHGLQDIEERFRKRYLDILMSPEVKNRFETRSLIIKELRLLLSKEGFKEVETPILQPLYGGALAEPFKTHHRLLDMDMYLRIAPELYLKRLIVAGFNKIFEIGRVFRNEGIDASHNPEFTMLELYEAYKDAEYLRGFISKLMSSLVKNVLKKPSIQFEDHAIKFPKKIPSIPFWSVVERYALIVNPDKISRDDMALKASQFGLSPESHDAKEKIADEIFKKICRPKLIQPVFVTNHPLAISPLAKQSGEDKNLVDRFQLIVAGLELVNGFSELNDPEEQRKRLNEQESMRKAEDKEAHPMDEEFIEALEHGMPPAAGLGLGIDRLVMLLSNSRNIKEVVLFPTLKPKK